MEDKARNKKVVTCYLEVEQVDALRELHRKTKIPMAVLIREGIDMVIEYRGRQTTDT